MAEVKAVVTPHPEMETFFFLCPTAFLKVPVHHISMVMVF